MQAVMTRVLLRARWIDKMYQGMFFGWKVAYERHCGLAGTELKMWCAIEVNRGFTTRV